MKSGDAPEIRRMERWGALEREMPPRCPVCGAECDWIYLDRGAEPVGCDGCLTRRDAWTVKEGVCGESR